MLKKTLYLIYLWINKMLRLAHFVGNLNRKMESCLVFWKHSEKIKVSSTLLQLSILQNLRLRGVFLDLRV